MIRKFLGLRREAAENLYPGERVLLTIVMICIFVAAPCVIALLAMLIYFSSGLALFLVIPVFLAWWLAPLLRGSI